MLHAGLDLCRRKLDGACHQRRPFFMAVQSGQSFLVAGTRKDALEEGA